MTSSRTIGVRIIVAAAYRSVKRLAYSDSNPVFTAIDSWVLADN